jgi:hypothetical protein
MRNRNSGVRWETEGRFACGRSQVVDPSGVPGPGRLELTDPVRDHDQLERPELEGILPNRDEGVSVGGDILSSRPRPSPRRDAAEPFTGGRAVMEAVERTSGVGARTERLRDLDLPLQEIP